MNNVNMTWEELVDYMKKRGISVRTNENKIVYFNFTFFLKFYKNGTIGTIIPNIDFSSSRTPYQMYQIMQALTEKGVRL